MRVALLAILAVIMAGTWLVVCGPSKGADNPDMILHDESPERDTERHASADAIVQENDYLSAKETGVTRHDADETRAVSDFEAEIDRLRELMEHSDVIAEHMDARWVEYMNRCDRLMDSGIPDASHAANTFLRERYPFVQPEAASGLSQAETVEFRNALNAEVSWIARHGISWKWGTNPSDRDLALGMLQSGTLFDLPPIVVAAMPLFGEISSQHVWDNAGQLQSIRIEFLREYVAKQYRKSYVDYMLESPDYSRKGRPALALLLHDYEKELARLRTGYIRALAQSIGAQAIPEVNKPE